VGGEDLVCEEGEKGGVSRPRAEDDTPRFEGGREGVDGRWIQRFVRRQLEHFYSDRVASLERGHVELVLQRGGWERVHHRLVCIGVVHRLGSSKPSHPPYALNRTPHDVG